MSAARRDYLRTSLRLRIAAWILPPGYAIWTWSLGVLEDEPIIEKEPK